MSGAAPFASIAASCGATALREPNDRNPPRINEGELREEVQRAKRI